MAKQLIGIGQAPNDGNGDPLRIAFDKVNDNFNEVYFALGTTGQSVISLFDSNGNLDLTGRAHKVSFQYSTKASLDGINPATYRGAIGHANDTGKLYYSDGSSWVELADAADVTGGSSSANTFGTIAISGQGSIVADSTTDTLNLAAGSNITLTSNTATDTITISASGGGSSSNTFSTISVGGTNIVADSTSDTVTLVAGSNISLSANTSTDSITISASGTGASNSVNLNSVDAAVVDVATDTIAFIDASDSGNTKKDTIVDFVAAIAGTNLTANSGVLNAQAGYTNSDVDTHLNVSSAASNQFLQWSGSDYQWAAASGGGASLSRTQQGVSKTVAAGATENIEFPGLGISYLLYKVIVDEDCWVRIYSDTASRTADAGRTQGQDPAEGAGIVAEFIATGGNGTTFKVTPGIHGWVDNSETEIPVAVTNTSGASATITTTLVGLPLES